MSPRKDERQDLAQQEGSQRCHNKGLHRMMWYLSALNDVVVFCGIDVVGVCTEGVFGNIFIMNVVLGWTK